MPTVNASAANSIPVALQRVFVGLQYSDKPVETNQLAEFFYWNFSESTPCNTQELFHALLDKLDEKMKGTPAEGTIPKLFEGESEMYIKCKNIDLESIETETFYNVQLKIEGKQGVYESLNEYIEVELLEGDNKYDAGKYGMQEAEKGVVFTRFPPVLHLQLMRFTYDFETDSNIKINDRYEFPSELHLDKYLKKVDLNDPPSYQLYAVLVHSGEIHSSQYTVFIDRSGTGRWLRFDDDAVCCSCRSEAIEQNFGGHSNVEISDNQSNACMLVYIRKSHLKGVLCQIDDSDTSSSTSSSTSRCITS